MRKRKWTPKEDKALVAALSQLCNAGWKRENGSFKSGYASELERKLKSILPGCNIKASPHIESRLKILKRHYDAITEMRDVDGIVWDSNGKMLTCEDDDVWENWVRTHSDVKGLRNKQFPHYDELHGLFGKRGGKKGVNIDSDGDKLFGDEDHDYDANLMVDDSLEGDDGGNEVLRIGFVDKKEMERKPNNDAATGGHVSRDVLNRSVLSGREGSSHGDDDSTGTYGSDDENISTDALTRKEKQPRARVLKRKRSLNGDDGPSKLGELANIFGNFLDKYQEHLSLLGEIVSGQMGAEKEAGEKRERLNGELKMLPNLNLQARLRAASLIVSDPPKLDLFYSLSKEERVEWVSMLLSGLI